MRKTRFFVFMLALTVLATAMPALAGQRKDPYDAYTGSPLELGVERNNSIVRGLIDGIRWDTTSKDFSRKSQFNTGLRWGNDGYGYDRYGRRFRRNQDGTRVADVVATVVTGAVQAYELHQINRKLDRLDRLERSEPQERQQAAPAIVTNRMGECVKINGQRVPDHDTTYVADIQNLQVTPLIGSSCQEVVKYPTGQASTGEMTYDLLCRR